MAAAERIERGYLGCLLRLTLLAPDIVAAILDGRQPEWMTLPGLMEGAVDWGGQLYLHRSRPPPPSHPPLPAAQS
jgi:hypothetical protein